MASIALIGPDGAGKTTVTRFLEASSLLPFKYLYMGINLEASNVALPTFRFIEDPASLDQEAHRFMTEAMGSANQPASSGHLRA